MTNIKKNAKNIRPPYTVTGVFALIALFTFTLGNPPQCPSNYTQVQVDAAQGLFNKCEVGANIGFGLMIMMILIPLAIVVLYMWLLFILQKLRNK